MHRFGDGALDFLNERADFGELCHEDQVRLSAALPQVEAVEDGECLFITLKECVTKHFLLQSCAQILKSSTRHFLETRFLSS